MINKMQMFCYSIVIHFKVVVVENVELEEVKWNFSMSTCTCTVNILIDDSPTNLGCNIADLVEWFLIKARSNNNDMSSRVALDPSECSCQYICSSDTSLCRSTDPALSMFAHM